MSNKKIRVLSFDPGLTKAGWSVNDYDPSTQTMHVVKYGFLTPKPEAAKVINRTEVEIFGLRVISLALLRRYIRELVTEYKPDYTATEDAFYCSRMPAAYGSLIQWIVSVENLLHDEFRLTMMRIAPKDVKHSISGSGNSGKLSVQQAILSNSNIQFRAKTDLLQMCEHEGDAIAVGWTFCTKFLPGMLNV